MLMATQKEFGNTFSFKVV